MHSACHLTVWHTSHIFGPHSKNIFYLGPTPGLRTWGLPVWMWRSWWEWTSQIEHWHRASLPLIGTSLSVSQSLVAARVILLHIWEVPKGRVIRPRLRKSSAHYSLHPLKGSGPPRPLSADDFFGAKKGHFRQKNMRLLWRGGGGGAY